MKEFTSLEIAALRAICGKYAGKFPQLPMILEKCEVIDRNNTGHGFYTEFRSRIEEVDFDWPRPIDGPVVRMEGMGDDAMMGILLWCETGKPSTLEGFQYGDIKGKTVDLRTRDLSNLSFTEFEWI